MADQGTPKLPSISPEHRRIAAESFDRANQVVASGNHDYAIQLLLTCCKLDPTSLIYRKALRKTEKAKYKNNQRGSTFSLLTSSPAKAKIKAAKGAGDYSRVLDYAEEVLVKNPWDTGAQMAMADAATHLGLHDLAIWSLEQAREKDGHDLALNRMLARLYEQRGNFTQAMQIWAIIRKDDPNDFEAVNKAKDLAAHETIARGHYQPSAEDDDEDDDDDAETKTRTRKFDTPLERAQRETVTLQQRIDADPTNVSLYLQLAAQFRRSGQLEPAREILQKGLAATGQNFQLLIEMMELELEPFRRNLTVTEDKLRAEAGNEELRKIRIRLLKEINTRELDLFRTKADRYPAELGHRLELGVRLLRGGQIDAAIHELQTARSDPRYQWRAFMFLGYCFKSRTNWRLAKRNFEDALKALPSNEEGHRKEILFHLAQGCADAGELPAAIELGLELANIDFAYRDIGRLIDEWQARVPQA